MRLTSFYSISSRQSSMVSSAACYNLKIVETNRRDAVSPHAVDFSPGNVSGEGDSEVEWQADDVTALVHPDDEFVRSVVDPERRFRKNLGNVNLNSTVKFEYPLPRKKIIVKFIVEPFWCFKN